MEGNDQFVRELLQGAQIQGVYQLCDREKGDTLCLRLLDSEQRECEVTIRGHRLFLEADLGWDL